MQQGLHHLGRSPLLNVGLPGVYRFPAPQHHEGFQPLTEKVAVLQKVVVIFHQQSHAFCITELQIQAGAGAHGLHQAIRDPKIAHLLALAFHINRSVNVKPAQGVPDQRVKVLLAGLPLARDQPQHRTAVASQSFQVEHLSPLAAQRLQQPCLA